MKKEFEEDQELKQLIEEVGDAIMKVPEDKRQSTLMKVKAYLSGFYDCLFEIDVQNATA